MSSGLQLVQANPPSAWKMYRAMVGVGVMCGLLIVGVFQLTRPIIKRNRAEALQRAIFQVLPDARSSLTFGFIENEGFVRVEGEVTGQPLVYAAYDDADQLVGLALEAAGMGYADVIRVLYGYSFADDAIVGVRVLESKETPGLGDKIEKDPDFLLNFVRLDVTLDTDGQTLAHPVQFVKHGQKQNPWEVDGITGATISSKAIANMLNESAAYWVPRVRRSLPDFDHPGNGETP